MPRIRCDAKNCLHNSNGFCGVKDECTVDISSDGQCQDYAPLTDAEYEETTGVVRDSCADAPKERPTPVERLEAINAELPNITKENLYWLVGSAEMVFHYEGPDSAHE